MKSGIDLKQVRKVVLYKKVGDPVSFLMTIVEAYDADNVPLGSFLGGWIIAPCL